jgi:PAS domain-containing protein
MARGYGGGAGSAGGSVAHGNDDQAPRARTGAAVLGPAVLLELVEAFPDGVLLIAADGTIMLASGRLAGMFGYSRGELAGRPVEVLIPSGQRAAHRAHRAAYARAICDIRDHVFTAHADGAAACSPASDDSL